MSRAAHPMLAPLMRGGGTAARLVASLAAAETQAAALEVDLEAHPLCRPGSWEAFSPPAAAEGNLAGLLARLVAAQGLAAEAVAAGSSAVAQPALRGRPRVAAPRDGTARRRAPSGVPAAVEARGSAATGPGASRRQSGESGPDNSRRPAGGQGAPRSAPPGLSIPDDPILRSAADRPVAPGAVPDFAQAVASILTGEPVGAARSEPTSDGGGQAAEARIVDALTRIPDSRSPSRRAGARTAPTAAGGFADRAPAGAPEPGARRDADLPAPRSGLERLLARGRRESLVPAGHAAGAEARLTSDQQAAAGAAPRGVPAIDLATSRRGPRALPPPGTGTVACDAEDFARALTDLLRREARSAGIDLKGGR